MHLAVRKGQFPVTTIGRVFVEAFPAAPICGELSEVGSNQRIDSLVVPIRTGMAIDQGPFSGNSSFVCADHQDTLFEKLKRKISSEGLLFFGRLAGEDGDFEASFGF
jgi:hypothetical protein